MKYIYQVSTCDTWKCVASARTEFCTTSVRRLKKEIMKLISEGKCTCRDNDALQRAFNCSSAYMIKESLNNILDYLFVEIWED